MQVKRFGVLLGLCFGFWLVFFEAVPGALEVAKKRETGALAGQQHFQNTRSNWFWQHGRTDLITCFTFWHMRNTCISWPVMLSLVSKGLFCTVKAGKRKQTKTHPLQFTVNVIAATVRFPILWICKTHMTVKSVQTKAKQLCGLLLYARFLNLFPVIRDVGWTVLKQEPKVLSNMTRKFLLDFML